AISTDQKTTSRNPRSTVGTINEIYDYLRLLYARIGNPHCPNCGKPISSHTIKLIIDQVLTVANGTHIQVLELPVIRQKGELEKILESIRREGFVRIREDE